MSVHWDRAPVDAEEWARKQLKGIGGPCTHSWRHTVYGAEDLERNGTWCQMCGKRLDGPQSREVASSAAPLPAQPDTEPEDNE